MKIEKAFFEICDTEEEKKFAGYHRPEIRWNGWACPLFPIETVNELFEHYKGSATKFEWSGENVITSFPNEDQLIYEPDVWEPVEILFEGQPVKVWPIGSHYWVWIARNEKGVEV